MSALLAPQHAPQKKPAPTRNLRPVVGEEVESSTKAFAGVTIMILALSVGALGWLNTRVIEQSNELVGLQKQETLITYQEKMLNNQVAELRSPRMLALKAADLGLVPNPNPVYIELPSGKVLGKAVPVTGNELSGTGE